MDISEQEELLHVIIKMWNSKNVFSSLWVFQV